MNELTDEQIENIYLDHRDQLPNIPLIRAIITADRAQRQAEQESAAAIAALERIAGDLQTLCDKQALMLGERDAQLESVGAGGVGAMIPKTIPDRTALIDLIAEHLSGTYHCTRVWSAWRVGTMSQDDFADVGESDTPSEITEAIIATLISQQIAEPAAATGWKWVPLEPTAEMLQAGQDTPVSESDEDAPEDYKAVYRAMLAAAPRHHQAAHVPMTDVEKHHGIGGEPQQIAAGRAQHQAALAAWQDAPTIDNADAIRVQRQAKTDHVEHPLNMVERQAGQEPLTIEHDRPSQAKDAEIERLKDALTFVERWANHHAQKPHVTAAEALSCIQHYPEIEAITESYADGKVPETRDPYAEIAALQQEVDNALALWTVARHCRW